MKVNVRELVLKTAGMMVLIAIALFLPAGTIAWTAGWAYFLLMFTFSTALTLWLFRFDPDLLAERLSGIGQPNQKAWDKVFLVLTAIAFFGWLVVMGFDAVRFQWSWLPPWLQAIGALLLTVSFYIFYITFRENTYLSPAVRVQTERAQRVVSTGPYQYVRHPLYAGFVLFSLGTALLLGSLYGVLGALVLIGMVAWRAVHEEEVLQEELPGYSEYMKRVRCRFVPHVW